MRSRREKEDAPYIPAIIGAVCASWLAIKVVDLAVSVFR